MLHIDYISLGLSADAAFVCYPSSILLHLVCLPVVQPCTVTCLLLLPVMVLLLLLLVLALFTDA